MARFKGGKFAGKTLKQVLLRDGPVWAWFESWAEGKPNLKYMLEEFRRLGEKLKQAPIYVKCYQEGCKRKAKSMTLPVSLYYGGYLPSPYYWCDKHKPWEKDGISPKFPIHFAMVKQFRDKQGQRQIHRRIRKAIGIPPGARITEKFAEEFFANLPKMQTRVIRRFPRRSVVS